MCFLLPFEHPFFFSGSRQYKCDCKDRKGIVVPRPHNRTPGAHSNFPIWECCKLASSEQNVKVQCTYPADYIKYNSIMYKKKKPLRFVLKTDEL